MSLRTYTTACEECEGSGGQAHYPSIGEPDPWRPCRPCDGTGLHILIILTDGDGTHHAVTQCERCRGEGHNSLVDEYECHVCGGRGFTFQTGTTVLYDETAVVTPLSLEGP